MDNDIDAAARHLIESIGAPDGSFSVLPWALENEQPRLRVLYDPMYRYIINSIPDEIDGFPVSVEPMPKMTGH